MGGCSFYENLQDEEDFIKSTKGSFIKVWASLGSDTAESEQIQGELIAIDSNKLYLLLSDYEVAAPCIAIERDKVYYFELYYAKPNTSFWTIPVFTAMTASHGIFSFITTPISGLVTSLTQAYIMRSSYSESNVMTIDELMPFARYPRGLPSGVRLEDIL